MKLVIPCYARESVDRQMLLHRLKAVTSAPRLQILSELKVHRRASLQELARVIRLSQKTTFYHLSRLLSRDIIQRIRKGKDVHYCLSRKREQPLQTILALL